MAEQPEKVGVYDRKGGPATPGGPTTTRRRRVPTWVWGVLAAVIVAFVAWWYLASKPADSPATLPTEPTTGSATGTPPAPPPAEQPVR
jgi:hypothetical protein